MDQRTAVYVMHNVEVSIGANVNFHVVRHVNSCTLIYLNLPINSAFWVT